MIHRIVRLLPLLVLLVSHASRARAETSVRVVATLTDLGRVAEIVGGSKVVVTTIASGVQDPHFVDPRPSHVVKLRDAELLLVNGLELEIGWVPPLLQGARNGRIRVGAPGYVDCSRGIPVLERPSGSVTRAEGDVHALGNPHYTTDPLNLTIVADTIADALGRLRPGDAAFFAQRKRDFERRIARALFGKELVDLVGGKKLARLARSGELSAFLERESSEGAPLAGKLGGWLARMAPVARERVVFYHKSYSYFVQRFGLNVLGYVEQRPGIQPGPTHLAQLVASMRREGVQIVATHPFYDQKIAELVASKGGARLVNVPLNLGGVPGSDDPLSFFDLVTTRLASAGK